MLEAKVESLAARRVLIWTRVSTDDQTTQNQITPLEEYAEAHGLNVVGRRELVGLSAWKPREHAREIKWLVDHAAAGEFDTVLIVALDRLSRRGPGETWYILKRLRDAGAQVVSLREPFTEIAAIDPLTAEYIQMTAAYFAGHESAVRSARTKAGMRRAKEQGLDVGRPRVTAYVDLDHVARGIDALRSWHEITRTHPRTVPTARGGMKRPSRGTIIKAWKEKGEDHGSHRDSSSGRDPDMDGTPAR